VRRLSKTSKIRNNISLHSKHGKSVEFLIKICDFIKSHKNTKEIVYPEYKESFDYVDSNFPHALIKEVKVYLCDHKLFFDIGIGRSLGFYSPISKIIVVAKQRTMKRKPIETLLESVEAKITLDEIIVHELLHYVSNSVVKGYVTREAEEEFAYGYSVRYLLDKGHSEKDIISNNFMPYLIGVVDKEKIKRKVIKMSKDKLGYDYDYFNGLTARKRKKDLKKVEKLLFKETIAEAKEIGKKIIKTYIDKKQIIEQQKENNDFDFMNLL